MITNEQWKTIQNELQSMFCSVRFKFQNHEISIEKRLVKENQYAYGVFLDGTINVGWGFDLEKPDKPNDKAHLVKLFWRKRARFLFSSKDRTELKKLYSRRVCKSLYSKDELAAKRARVDEQMVYYDPTWPKSGPLIRQLKKIKELEFIEN